MTRLRWQDSDGDSVEGQDFDWFDLLVIGATIGRRLFSTASDACESLDIALRATANKRRDDREWASGILQQIEKL